MKKILLLTNTASMILQFNMRNIDILKKNGYEVYIACNFKSGNTCSSELIEDFKSNIEAMNINYFQIDFGRNLGNALSFFNVYKQVTKVVRENKIDIIFCQSTIAGVIGRIVGKKYDSKVIYMVHGFQFYEGASFLRWLVFYNIEKTLSKKTDILILTNKDDYEIAQKKFHAKQIVYVPGVGIELNNFIRNEQEGIKIRNELGLNKNDFVIVSAGELSERKNLRVVLHIIKEINNPKIKYLVCGIGLLEKEFKDFIKDNHLQNQIFLLGYRKDLCNILSAANLFVFPSFYEGLPVSLMMALSTKTPVVCSKIRGNTDLINNTKYMFDPKDKNMIKETILMAMNNDNNNVVEENLKSLQAFSSEKVDSLMSKIFQDNMG